jgi:hypothetical protein
MPKDITISRLPARFGRHGSGKSSRNSSLRIGSQAPLHRDSRSTPVPLDLLLLGKESEIDLSSPSGSDQRVGRDIPSQARVQVPTIAGTFPTTLPDPLVLTSCSRWFPIIATIHYPEEIADAHDDSIVEAMLSKEPSTSQVSGTATQPYKLHVLIPLQRS